jgi:hypothetical protein
MQCSNSLDLFCYYPFFTAQKNQEKKKNRKIKSKNTRGYIYKKKNLEGGDGPK